MKFGLKQLVWLWNQRRIFETRILWLRAMTNNVLIYVIIIIKNCKVYELDQIRLQIF